MNRVGVREAVTRAHHEEWARVVAARPGLSPAPAPGWIIVIQGTGAQTTLQPCA